METNDQISAHLARDAGLRSRLRRAWDEARVRYAQLRALQRKPGLFWQSIYPPLPPELDAVLVDLLSTALKSRFDRAEFRRRDREVSRLVAGFLGNLDEVGTAVHGLLLTETRVDALTYAQSLNQELVAHNRELLAQRIVEAIDGMQAQFAYNNPSVDRQGDLAALFALQDQVYELLLFVLSSQCNLQRLAVEVGTVLRSVPERSYVVSAAVPTDEAAKIGRVAKVNRWGYVTSAGNVYRRVDVLAYVDSRRYS